MKSFREAGFSEAFSRSSTVGSSREPWPPLGKKMIEEISPTFRL